MFGVIKCLSSIKKLSKAITTRTKLSNNILENKSEENKKLYVKQRNFCVSLLIKFKKRYYENLKSVIDNQKQPPEMFYKKKVFLEILQNSRQNTCARASFLIKLQSQFTFYH